MKKKKKKKETTETLAKVQSKCTNVIFCSNQRCETNITKNTVITTHLGWRRRYNSSPLTLHACSAQVWKTEKTCIQWCRRVLVTFCGL